MKYAWKIVAGELGQPAGVVDTYRTKADARAAWPRYAAHLVRVRVSKDEWLLCKGAAKQTKVTTEGETP
jgi:hypothetical protein